MNVFSVDFPVLLPMPRQLSVTGEPVLLPSSGLIVVDGPDPEALLFAAGQLRQALADFAGLEWHEVPKRSGEEVVAGQPAFRADVRAVLRVDPDAELHEQGYALTLTPERIDVVAPWPAGVFYAVQTLRQLVQQFGAEPPALHCVDWPDFPNRGVMLDVSRDKVPTMQTLYDLVDLLAGWKINQFQLYTEHTFAYRNHHVVWAEASPLTGDEIVALDAYCRQRFVELVPNQNTFGHMHRWLIHEPYRALAEAPEGAQTKWGFYWQGPYSLSPVLPQSLDLVREMLDELLPNFSSTQVNVGLDETFDVGQGLSRQEVEARGLGQVYLDFLLKVYREVTARGRTMQYWGDIIMEHPEIVPGLPRDAIALEWGYEWCHPFERHAAALAQAGIPFYLCPGTSSWRSLAGRTDNALANLRDAAVYGMKYGAVGYLNTDWGDEGHWQPLPVSYLGLAVGAAWSWSYDANKDADVPRTLGIHAFRDAAGQMGALAYELGNVYKEIRLDSMNSSPLFNAMLHRPDWVRSYAAKGTGNLAEQVAAAGQRIDAAMARLPQARMERSDAALIEREFAWAADMLRHGCRRLLWITGDTADNARIRQQLADDADRLMAEYRVIWHARNRPGGYKDSIARMERMHDDYLRPLDI